MSNRNVEPTSENIRPLVDEVFGGNWSEDGTNTGAIWQGDDGWYVDRFDAFVTTPVYLGRNMLEIVQWRDDQMAALAASDRQWGGKREGAGSGGPRPGAGRPRKTWASGGPGQRWVVEMAAPGGLPSQPQIWAVLSIDADGSIEFQDVNTEQIISIIHPDKYE